MKKLYRSNTNKIFSGLLGGIGEYFDVDPVFVRLVYLALVIFTAVVPGVFLYILALLIVPVHPTFEVVREYDPE